MAINANQYCVSSSTVSGNSLNLSSYNFGTQRKTKAYQHLDESIYIVLS